MSPGVSGNGQRELAEAIFGLRPIARGGLQIGEEWTTEPTPKQVREMGLAYVPEERMRDGAVGDFTVAENLMLVDFDRAPYVSGGLLNRRRIVERCTDLVQRYRVKTPDIDTPTRNLSGGNIQKVVIAREFSSDATGLRRGATDPRCRHRRRGVHPRTPARTADATARPSC